MKFTEIRVNRLLYTVVGRILIVLTLFYIFSADYTVYTFLWKGGEIYYHMFPRALGYLREPLMSFYHWYHLNLLFFKDE